MVLFVIVDDILVRLSLQSFISASEKCGSRKVWHICSMAQYHNPYCTNWDWELSAERDNVFNALKSMFSTCFSWFSQNLSNQSYNKNMSNEHEATIMKRHILFNNLFRISTKRFIYIILFMKCECIDMRNQGEKYSKRIPDKNAKSLCWISFLYVTISIWQVFEGYANNTPLIHWKTISYQLAIYVGILILVFL